MTPSERHPLPTPKSRQTRQELLTASQRVFEEHGYFDTRVADIVHEAKVSHGTFYTYFSDKDDALRVLIAGMVNDLFEISSNPVEHHETPYLTLQATIRQFMHAYRDWAGLMRILEQAVAFSDEFLAVRQSIRDRFRERLELVVREHQRRHGNPDRLNARLAAYALGGMVDDFARGCYILGHPVAERDAVDTLSVIWARAVGIEVERRPKPDLEELTPMS